MSNVEFYYLLAGVVAACGVAAYVFMERRGGYSVMSNISVSLRAVVIVIAMDAAIWLYMLGSEGSVANPAGRRIFAIGIFVYSAVAFAGQASLVRTRRRQLVGAWKDGAPLPAGVSEESVRAWAHRHMK